MGKPKRGTGEFEMFNHPSTVRSYKRRMRKKAKNALKMFYDIKEWELRTFKRYNE